jgi:Right handed beta helix region
MRTLWISCAFVFLFTAELASAATFTMGFPPPGGVTFTQAGNGAGSASGLTFAFTGFNTAQYNTLYWGLNSVANVNQGVANGNMVFQGYNPATGIAVWTSTSNWVFTSGNNGGCCNIGTQLLVQLQPFTGSNVGFLSSGFLSPTTTKGALGSSGDPNEPLFQIVSGASFQAMFELMTWDGVPGDAGNPSLATDIFDYNFNNNGGPGVTSSEDFEFWWTFKATSAKTVQVGTCMTSLKSYPSISAALSVVGPGATVDICPGTYPEQLTISSPVSLVGVVSGTAAAAVLTVPSSGLTLNGTGPNSGSHASQIAVQDVGPVTIKNLIVDGSSSVCPPPGFVDGIAFLSNTGTASGKVLNSSVRNTANDSSCSGVTLATGIFAESGSSLPLTVQGNTVHAAGSNGIIFAFGQTGTITGNTVSSSPSGIDLFNPGAAVKVTSNAVNGGNSGIGLSSASSAVVQLNTITALTGTALSLQSGGGGSNNVTKNTVNDANCGISKGQAASSDVYLPNTAINVVSTQCQ